MRPRKWVLVVACFILLVAFALLEGKRNLERNRDLENLLVNVVGTAIGGTCSVDAIRIGFLSVHLKNVTLSLPLQSLSLSIRSIKVGISFGRLVEFRGDITRSINQIIIIGPRLDIALPQGGAVPPAPTRTPPGSGGTVAATAGPALIQYVSVKNGNIRIRDHDGDTIEIAHNLTGTLSSSVDNMSIVLSGRSGSPKNNVSLRGELSWPDNEHHFSLRITGASLDKPFSFGDITVSDGTVGGAAECTFTNTFSPDSMELNGWMNLESGTASFGRVPLRLDSLQMRLGFENRSCRITSLDALFNGLRLDAKGDFIVIGQQSARITLHCPRFAPAAFLGIVPDSILGEFSGIGTLDATVALSAGNDPLFSLAARGFEVHGYRLDNFTAAGRVSGKKIIADSIAVATPFFRSRLQGFYDLDTSKIAYDAGFSVVVDSIPGATGFGGELRIIGSVATGSDRRPVVSSRIATSDLHWQHLALGNPQLVANFTDNRCTFSSVAVDASTAVIISGAVDSVFTRRPKANCSIIIGAGPIKEQLKRMHGVPPIDSAYCSVNASGWINGFTAAAELFVSTAVLRGTLTAQLGRSPSDTGAFIWQLGSDDMHYKKLHVPFSGRGILLDSSIAVDTLTGYGGIRGSARIHFAASPPRLDARLLYKKNIAELTPFFTGAKTGLDSGTVEGITIIDGPFDSLQTRSSIKLRNVGTDAIAGFSTDLTITTHGTHYIILPATIKRGVYPVLSLDTIQNTSGALSFRGTFANVTPRTLLGPLIAPDLDIEAFIGGTIATTAHGLPLEFTCSAPYVALDTIRLDSLRCRGAINENGMTITRLDFRDSTRSTGHLTATVPWSLFGTDATDLDTLKGTLRLDGDLLATIERNTDSPVGGSGQGRADIAFTSAGGVWKFTRGIISLPQGILRVRPFVLDDIKEFTFLATIDSNAVVHTDMSGTIRRRPIRIFSVHDIPDGYEPLMIGPLNFGMFQTVTPKKGVDLHLPGFMALRERGDIEFRGKKPFDNFTISGPLDKLKLTGTWVLRDVEFTFPLLPNHEIPWGSDPFPYITWEMDIMPGNRKAMYFWELTGKRNRIMRFLEAYLDPSSLLKVRGRDLDKTFRLNGTIRSFKGAVYYGRVFDRNFDVGVEFNPQQPDPHRGFDNLPVIWGSAEAFSDTSRQNRTKLTCMITDPTTRSVSERGRLADAPTPNITFQLSSDFDELPGESEREYYRQAGITFSTFEGAGNAVSGLGEQMFHRFLLQRWERMLARKLGLDVMNIETSFVSNYFNKLYSRQFDGLLNEEDYLALANIGVTVGRYFFRDNILLKARGELVPIEMALTPEYSIGFEFQPSRYLMMDVNYGFHMTDGAVMYSPLLMLQLRLPINRVRNLLKF